MTETDWWSMLNELLARGVIDIVGGKLSPPTAARKREAAQSIDRPMPDSLQTLLASAHGAYVGSINLFTLDEMRDVHYAQDYLFTYMPSAIFFASDGGDGFFFCDPDNSLGRGKEAVFWVYRGSAVPNHSVPCGRDLKTFLDALATGEAVWNGLSIEEEAIAHMLDALDTWQDRWTGQAGARLGEVLDIADQHRLRAPKVLEKLLRRSNGITFARAGTRIWQAQQVERVEATFSDGYQPLALLIGEKKGGTRYAITHRDHPTHVPDAWPHLEGWIVRLPADRPLEAAEPLGYLPDLVIEWLG